EDELDDQGPPRDERVDREHDGVQDQEAQDSQLVPGRGVPQEILAQCHAQRVEIHHASCWLKSRTTEAPTLLLWPQRAAGVPANPLRAAIMAKTTADRNFRGCRGVAYLRASREVPFS